MVRKAWVPVNAAFVAAGTRATYDTAKGQTYAVESGREYVASYINDLILTLFPALIIPVV